MSGVVVVAIALGVPALVFTLWPLLRRRGAGVVLLPLPPDAREHWLDAKRVALRALRELAFEHAAGHISDADYQELHARYEAEAAAALTELDRLGPAPAVPAAPAAVARAAGSARGWRHPVALGASGAALLVFGVLLGVGIVRYTEPDPMAAPAPMPPLAGSPAATTAEGTPRAVPPEVLRGMLQAARGSLAEGRYSEAIAAYQAVLKRDPDNVDAMTHLGLIVAIGGHADSALETFEKALALQPDYPPALLYRGQVLYEAKKDVAGAVRSWERFVQVAPSAEDRARVQKLIAEARAASPGR